MEEELGGINMDFKAGKTRAKQAKIPRFASFHALQ